MGKIDISANTMIKFFEEHSSLVTLIVGLITFAGGAYLQNLIAKFQVRANNTENRKARSFEIRREIYLEAAIKITKANQLLASIANKTVAEVIELEEKISLWSTLSQLRLVASKQLILHINEYITFYLKHYLEFIYERAIIDSLEDQNLYLNERIENLIQHNHKLYEQFQILNNSSGQLTSIEQIRNTYMNNSNEITKLEEQKISFEKIQEKKDILIKKSLSAIHKIDSTLNNVSLVAREELEFGQDNEDLKILFEKSRTETTKIVESYLDKL